VIHLDCRINYEKNILMFDSSKQSSLKNQLRVHGHRPCEKPYCAHMKGHFARFLPELPFLLNKNPLNIFFTIVQASKISTEK
jgi:hypothetical protein